jgi:hypothetical protein
MNNYDIRTKPYDLLVELVKAKNKGEIKKGLMTEMQINNLSFELLLFYLMFIIGYLNSNEISKNIGDINLLIRRMDSNLIEKQTDKKIIQKYDVNMIKLLYQAHASYTNIDTFEKLKNRIITLPESIKIHKYYINFLIFLNNFIILNNSIRTSVRTPPEIIEIKNKIKEIFSIIVHFTYESQKGTHIHIEKEILFRIKYIIIELIKKFNQYKLISPIQCLEQKKCTDIIFLNSLEQHIKNFEKAKKIYLYKK